jgi:hypothetical protein
VGRSTRSALERRWQQRRFWFLGRLKKPAIRKITAGNNQ